MFSDLEIAVAEERRKDVLRQAEQARRIERAVPTPDYAHMLFEEASATLGHAGRFVRVLLSAIRALLFPRQAMVHHR